MKLGDDWIGYGKKSKLKINKNPVSPHDFLIKSLPKTLNYPYSIFKIRPYREADWLDPFLYNSFTQPLYCLTTFTLLVMYNKESSTVWTSLRNQQNKFTSGLLYVRRKTGGAVKYE